MMTLEEFIDEFREFVLDGMDVATTIADIDAVKDEDLPELFKTLDALAEKLWKRKNVE